MSIKREKITPEGLINIGFSEKKIDKYIYYEKNTFMLTPGLNDWTYGWEEGDPVSGNLSQIIFMDEIEPVMNFKNK